MQIVNSPTNRPRCPECGREMVFALIEAGDLAFQAWICDCREQPPGVVADIINARKTDGLSLEFEVIHVDDSEPA
jgi:hypothetical protein